VVFIRQDVVRSRPREPVPAPATSFDAVLGHVSDLRWRGLFPVDMGLEFVLSSEYTILGMAISSNWRSWVCVSRPRRPFLV
jgi:hypothetical protein